VSGSAGKGVVVAAGGRRIAMVCARLIAGSVRSASLVGNGSELRRLFKETLRSRG